MKQTIMAARRQTAHERLVLESQRLAAVLGLPDPVGLEPQERNPAVRQLKRDEYLGGFLAQVRTALPAPETLEQAEGYLSQADILAIPGLTKTSKDAINAYFANLERDASAE